MRAKNQLIIFSIAAIAIFSIIIYTSGILNSQNRTNVNEFTYEQFNEITKDITDDVISKEYSNYIVMSPSFTIYPGNPDEEWTNDKFNMVDNNIGQPKTITIYVVENEIITRIDMVFQPNLSDKYYLNVSRTDNNIRELAENNITVPSIYTNSFTSEGIYYSISTFHTMNDFDDAKQVESLMIEINTKITRDIQRFLVDNNL